MAFNYNSEAYQEDLKTILQIKGIETLKNKRFLITGASGLIGVPLIDALMSIDNVVVYAVGRSKEKAMSRLGHHYCNDRFFFIEQDVRESFPQNLSIDYIVPLASNTHPLAYSSYPIETVLINVVGAVNALDLAVRCNAIVLYPSSVEVYGNAKGDDIFSEDYTGQLNLSTSRSCYSESKRVCEALCQSYIAERDVDVRIVRLSRLFGPTILSTDTKASSQFILKAVSGDDIVLKSQGNQYFSYTYVADAVTAMLYILIHGNKGEAYNISNIECNIHLREFAEICAKYNNKSVIYDLPSELERKGYSIAQQAILDNSKLLKLGWVPKYNMRTAIYRTIDLIKEWSK